jgi:hypothetical protein
VVRTPSKGACPHADFQCLRDLGGGTPCNLEGCGPMSQGLGPHRALQGKSRSLDALLLVAPTNPLGGLLQGHCWPLETSLPWVHICHSYLRVLAAGLSLGQATCSLALCRDWQVLRFGHQGSSDPHLCRRSALSVWYVPIIEALWGRPPRVSYVSDYAQ